MSKVHIVRFWVLAIFAVAWAVLCYDPTFAILPLAFFTGQANCFCCSGTCSVCSTGTTPAEISVTLSGITNGSCSDCTTLNDTFVVVRGSGTSCLWSYDIDPDICTDYKNVTVFLFGTTITVSTGTDGLFEHIDYYSDVGSAPFDCGFSAYDVPYLSGAVRCSGASSTCEITAL